MRHKTIRKKIILITLIIAGAIAATVAGAVIVHKSLPGTVTIQSTPGLSVLDNNCATELATLSFPSLGGTVASTSSLTVCMKNTGNQNFYIIQTTPADSITFTGLPTGISGQWTASNLPATLGPGQTMTATLTLTNDGSAVAGMPSFAVSFTGYNTITG